MPDKEYTHRYETIEGELWHVYEYKDRMYRIKDKDYAAISQLFAFPEVIRQNILFVAKMRHNPD